MTDTIQSTYEYLTVSSLAGGRVVRISMNRPKSRNAQNRGLLVELGQAFMAAEADDAVRVVILAGEGSSFSAGHDLGTEDDRRERSHGPGRHPSFDVHGGTCGGAEGRARQEWHYYYENTRRWRNLRKITIAEVQGTVISAGLMLMWACDLIVAADDARFADVVGTRLGMCGVEYFAHPWEIGPRRAKEMLLTGDALSAEEAFQIGMVNKLFPADRLPEMTLEFAERVAKLPTMAALLVKESVNQSQDSMGFYDALNSCFTIHQLNHAHWSEMSGGKTAIGTVQYGLDDWRAAPAIPTRDGRSA